MEEDEVMKEKESVEEEAFEEVNDELKGEEING